MAIKALQICGIRGIPAKHGGFETFAERLAVYLAKQGWNVTVYCQVESSQPAREHYWNGVRLIDIPVKGIGPLSTILFDFRSVLQSWRRRDTVLTLGYNTAIFSVLYRFLGVSNLINMDGLEWRRDKWKLHERAWLYLNERVACWLGNHLIADHPLIEEHLSTRVSRAKITMIPYGADYIDFMSSSAIEGMGLQSKGYSVVIARPEPENSILEIVRAFSAKERGSKLVVLGNFDTVNNSYHRNVVDAASDEVVFTGAIYDKEIVSSLRYHARIYIHGHTVGGTNPSLVEALGAGNAILAHDNKFNRWVAKDGAIYFSDISPVSSALEQLFNDDELVELLQSSSRDNFLKHFQWNDILQQYEQLLIKWLPKN